MTYFQLFLGSFATEDSIRRYSFAVGWHVLVDVSLQHVVQAKWIFRFENFNVGIFVPFVNPVVVGESELLLLLTKVTWLETHALDTLVFPFAPDAPSKIILRNLRRLLATSQEPGLTNQPTDQPEMMLIVCHRIKLALLNCLFELLFK